MEDNNLQDLLNADIGAIAEKGQDKQKKTVKALIISAVVALAVIAAAVLVVTKVVTPANNNKTAEAQYVSADELLAASEKAKAAISFGKLGDYKDAKARAATLWGEIAVRDTIASGANHTVGLKSDGTVVTVGNNSTGQCNVGSWSGIKVPNR